jgi:hypothetical protein
VEQLQRLFVINTETAAKPGAVRREAVLNHAATGAQALFELRDVGAEIGKVRRDIQVALRANKETRRLALRILQPEHLGQRHRLVVTGVVKHAKDDRIAVGIAQAHRLRRPGNFIALGLVMAEHIGTQRTLFRIRPGRLVVGDALGGNEQRGDGIDQRRFARADIAGQQRIFAIELHRPDALVEGAPVEHFQPVQAEAGERVVGDEIEAEVLRG